MLLEHETIRHSIDSDVCLGGHLTVKYSTASDSAIMRLEKILESYDQHGTTDVTVVSRDDGNYLRYYIDLPAWCSEEFHSDLVLWQLAT
jgi:hypothetical protein